MCFLALLTRNTLMSKTTFAKNEKKKKSLKKIISECAKTV